MLQCQRTEPPQCMMQHVLHATAPVISTSTPHPPKHTGATLQARAQKLKASSIMELFVKARLSRVKHGHKHSPSMHKRTQEPPKAHPSELSALGPHTTCAPQKLI